jgi:DHA1 family bicyclomycin/chloramphenicol resistance-like MFS transporter
MPMQRWLPLLLGFLQAAGPMSTDMYLPAFPAIERGFGTGPGSAQVTLAAWLAGLACGQIMMGPVSDRFGRRAPLLAGTAAFTLASAACALAPGLWALTCFRFVAALGASASTVVPRAIVRDFADGHAAAALMARLMLVMGAAPILAPTLGGALLAVTDWRAIFWVCTGYGALALALSALLLPDTLPEALRIPLHPGGIARRYLHVLTERGFLTHAMILSCTGFTLFTYLGGSPAVFILRYGLSPAGYGMIFGLNAAVYILAAQANARVLRLVGTDRVLRVASALLLLGCACLAWLAWQNRVGLAGFCAVLMGVEAMMGFLLPSAQVGALSRHAAHAGSASALLGTLQFTIGASGGLLVGMLAGAALPPALPMALLMLGGAAGAKLADLCRPRAAG